MSFLNRLFSRQSPPVPSRRSFDAATGGRRASAFRHFGATGPETLAASGPIRARARHAYANNAYVRNAVNAIVAETVGAGIEANSAHPDPDIRERIDSRWLTCAEEIDADGRTDFRGLTSAMVLSEVVDGEAFALIEAAPEGLRVRQIPAEFIDAGDTRDLGDGRYIVSGIEFGADGTRLAYHVRPDRPTDLYPTTGDPIRVDAGSVVHLMRPMGPGQVRGVSQLAPILLTVAEYDLLQDALLKGQQISALHAGFIVDQNGLGGASPYPEADLGDVSLEPGTVRVLPAGTDIRFSAPDQAKDGVGFAKLTLGQVAAGLGVPQHLCDGDLTGANYSSLRAGLLPFRAKVEQYQYQTLAPQMLTPIFRRVIAREYAAGRLDLPELAPALAVEWLAPRPMQVDPQKDVAALGDMLDRGLISRRQAVASLGWNVADLDAEIAADRARETALGLTFTKATADD